MNYKLGREQHGQYERTNKKKRKKKKVKPSIDQSRKKKKRKKTVETQTAVQKEQRHPAAVTTIKLCLKSFLIITKRRLV